MIDTSLALLVGLAWSLPVLLFVIVDSDRSWTTDDAEIAWLAAVCFTSWLGLLAYVLWRRFERMGSARY